MSGTRLAVRPLTVLCGSNGSGKSTWLKVLNMLKVSVSSKRLPFGFSVEDWSPRDIQVTNAFYHLADPAMRDGSSAVAQFGRPGTIGLEIHASRDQWLAPANREADERRSAAWNFQWAGQCKEKCPSEFGLLIRRIGPTRRRRPTWPTSSSWRSTVCILSEWRASVTRYRSS